MLYPNSWQTQQQIHRWKTQQRTCSCLALRSALFSAIETDVIFIIFCWNLLLLVGGPSPDASRWLPMRRLKAGHCSIFRLKKVNRILSCTSWSVFGHCLKQLLLLVGCYSWYSWLLMLFKTIGIVILPFLVFFSFCSISSLSKHDVFGLASIIWFLAVVVL